MKNIIFGSVLLLSSFSWAFISPVKDEAVLKALREGASQYLQFSDSYTVGGLASDLQNIILIEELKDADGSVFFTYIYDAQFAIYSSENGTKTFSKDVVCRTTLLKTSNAYEAVRTSCDYNPNENDDDGVLSSEEY